jgi:hypothetical protein
VDKTTFIAILQDIVEGFEDAGFKGKMAAAKGAGDVGQLIALPTSIQTQAFGKRGLDAETGVAAFKLAGRTYGLEPEAAPLLARMKAALA